MAHELVSPPDGEGQPAADRGDASTVAGAEADVAGGVVCEYTTDEIKKWGDVTLSN